MKLSMLSASVALALLAAGHGSSWALGLGEARALSGLNQPLKAEVEVLADASELASVKLSLASPEAYRQQGIDFPAALAGAQVSLVKRNGARSVALISASGAFQEPYVTIMLDGQSASGKVRRVYSVFIDPANTGSAQKLPGESSFVEVQRKLPILPPLVKGAKGAAAEEQVVAIVAPAPAVVPAKAVEPEHVMYTNISEVGKAPAKLDVMQGYGKGVDIKHALFTIVPKGWKGFSGEKSMKLAGKVTWSAGRSWAQTLDGILADAHLSATVNWDKKEITFYSLNGASKAASAAAMVAPAPKVDAPAPAPQTADVAGDQAPASQVAAPGADVVAGVRAELSQARAKLAEVEKLLAEAKSSAKSAEEARAQLQFKLNEETKRAIALSADLAKVSGKKSELEKAQAQLTVSQQGSQDAAAKLEQASAALKAAEADRDQALARLGEADAKYRARNEEVEKNRRDLTAEIQDLRTQLEQVQAKAAGAASDRDHYQAQNKHLLRMLEVTRDRMSKMRWGMPEPTPEKSAKFSSLRLINGDMIQENVIGSAGLNVALPSALSQIVPSGWMVITAPEVGTPAVSWTGGQRPWIQVLEDVLKAQNLTATVDAVTREIQVSPAK